MSASSEEMQTVEAKKLAQPKVKATNVLSSGKIKLTWNEIEGAKEYKVYRATSKNGKYTLMKTVTGTSYTNTSAKAGKLYYYKVKAIHSNSDRNSAFSAIVSRTCDLARPSVKASIVSSTGKIKLKWNAIEGAEEYKIYRSTSKNGDYTLMKTVTGTSYTNTSAKAGKTYFYKVKAIHSNTNANSAFSTVVKKTAKAVENTSGSGSGGNDGSESSQGEVWIPQSGSKYHSHSGCSNMKNPTKVTKQEAKDRGYEPCKKCW